MYQRVPGQRLVYVSHASLYGSLHPADRTAAKILRQYGLRLYRYPTRPHRQPAGRDKQRHRKLRAFHQSGTSRLLARTDGLLQPTGVPLPERIARHGTNCLHRECHPLPVSFGRQLQPDQPAAGRHPPVYHQ